MPIFKVKAKLIILGNYNGLNASCENSSIVFSQPQNLGTNHFQRILWDFLAPAEAFALFLIGSAIPADAAVARNAFVGLAATGTNKHSSKLAQLWLGAVCGLIG